MLVCEAPRIAQEYLYLCAASGVWCEWGGSALPRVAPPALEASAFSPRAPLHPPVPHPAAVALVLHNRYLHITTNTPSKLTPL